MKIADKNVRAVDLVREALDKAKKFEEYNVFISLNEQGALKKAREIDRRIAAGKPVGKLAGVPYALKDNFLSREGETTAASKMLANFQAPITSTAVERIEAEGAIMIGRTNLDAFAHGGSTENSYFGPTRNSRDKTRVAGGSSGGSAVAVALNIVPFAFGSDTGGSIRQPAAYNGIVGIKPTFGTVSRYGVVAMASSTDTIGCFAADAADADSVMGIMAGSDAKDSTTLPDFWAEEPTDKRLRVGLITDFMSDGTDKAVKDCIGIFADKLKATGHTVEEIAMPTLKYGLAIYYIVQTAEAASNLCKFDGVRYGYRAEGAKDLDGLYEGSRNDGLMPENKRRIMIGNFVLSSGFFDAYYLKAQKARTLLIAEYEKAFEQFDVLLCPTAPTPAFGLDEKTGDPLQMYMGDLMAVPPSMAGLPAVSVPAGETAEGLTVGAQLIGPRRSDRLLLKLAKEMM